MKATYFLANWTFILIILQSTKSEPDEAVDPTRPSDLAPKGDKNDTCMMGEAEKHAWSVINDAMIRYDKHKAPSINGVDVDLELLIQRVYEPNALQSSIKMDVFISHAILPNGTVWLSHRSMVELQCDFNYKTFPMDKVECSAVIESYSFNVGKVRLHWKRHGNPVEIIGNVNLPDFLLTNFIHEKATYQYPAGNWDNLHLKVFFRRSYGFYVLLFFIPAYFMVLLSWIAFWIKGQAITSRVILGLFPILLLAMLYANVVCDLPKLNYIKFIDVFMFVESAMVGLMQAKDGTNMGNKSGESELLVINSGELHPSNNPMSASANEPRAGFKRSIFRKFTGENLDSFSRIFFPLSFIVINIVLWAA